MSARSGTSGFASPHGLRVGLTQLFGRLVPADRRLLRRSALPKEVVLATLGPVELRRTRAGFVARTAVKGEQDAALQTALRRLADYADGDNRAGLPMRTARPIVQLPGAPGTWLTRIGLPGVYVESAAPTPRSPKVRIMAQPSETLANIRLSGRPQPQSLARGEAAIRAAIAGNDWVVCGPALLRLHAPPGLLPWTGSFEVAVPVAEA
jgi:SOUL heme-binding protein